MNISYGVIVGRFQVNNLHPGHLELFRQVSEKHDRVIVFIAIPRTIPTARNPMDFETRKKMIQADFPDFTILPLRDEKRDQFWSERLDESIASVTQHTENVVLYGGRDSFIPHYYGHHKVQELDITSPITGTEIRQKASTRIMQSSDFRSGVIYAAANRLPSVLPTVDCAIFYNNGDGTYKLCLAKKPGEMYYRFVGGFVNLGEDLETAVRREVYEETWLTVSSLEYLASQPVHDWRYFQDPDAGILTNLFIGWSPNLGGKANDDIESIRWFDYEELPPVVEAAHMELYKKVKEWWSIRRAWAGLGGLNVSTIEPNS